MRASKGAAQEENMHGSAAFCPVKVRIQTLIKDKTSSSSDQPPVMRPNHQRWHALTTETIS